MWPRSRMAPCPASLGDSPFPLRTGGSMTTRSPARCRPSSASSQRSGYSTMGTTTIQARSRASLRRCRFCGRCMRHFFFQKGKGCRARLWPHLVAFGPLRPPQVPSRQLAHRHDPEHPAPSAHSPVCAARDRATSSSRERAAATTLRMLGAACFAEAFLYRTVQRTFPHRVRGPLPRLTTSCHRLALPLRAHAQVVAHKFLVERNPLDSRAVDAAEHPVRAAPAKRHALLPFHPWEHSWCSHRHAQLAPFPCHRLESHAHVRPVAAACVQEGKREFAHRRDSHRVKPPHCTDDLVRGAAVHAAATRARRGARLAPPL